jgi:hypothetical protein
VLNGCRSEFRRQKAARPPGSEYVEYFPPALSAECAALVNVERREVLQALGRSGHRR